MDWIKIPTDNILYSEFKDSELVALVKYQALYCQLEKEPSNEQIKRILNKKQREFIKSNAEVVQELCKSQVQIVKTKRNKDKESYKQKQTLIENSDVGKLSERKLVHGAEKIREDKIRKENIKENKYPTLEELKEYATTRDRLDIADRFFDYFNATGWVDSKGKQVNNWKGKFVTWETHTPKPEKKEPLPTMTEEEEMELLYRGVDR